VTRSAAREITSFSKKEINLLFKHAKSVIRKQGLDIRLAPKAQKLAKILLIVPRKAGNSPERNLLKRRLKSIFYEERWFQKEFDWIIVARKEAIDIPFSGLRSLLQEAYQATQSTN